jgi:hypothetical protein
VEEEEEELHPFLDRCEKSVCSYNTQTILS